MKNYPRIRLAVIGVIGIFFATGAAPARAEHRHNPTSRLVQTEIMLKQITGPSQGLFYGLKWSRSGARCRATQGNPGQPQEWVPIPSRACTGLRNYIIEHRVKLRKSRLSKKYVYKGTKPRAYLEFSGSRFLVTTLTGPVCDDDGENCKRPVLSEASKLGVQLRQAINREIGRLPEWIKAPGTETLGDPVEVK